MSFPPERGASLRAAARPFNINTFYRRITRNRYHARGLNSCGKPPGKKHFPELAGLPRREWRRLYMKLRRTSPL